MERITNGEEWNECRLLVGKPERKRPLRRSKRTWFYNIKICLREIGFDGIGWIYLTQDRDELRTVMNEALNHRLP
jgi:hypothetical protein